MERKKKKKRGKKFSGLGIGHMDFDSGCGRHKDKREKRANTRNAKFRKALNEEDYEC